MKFSVAKLMRWVVIMIVLLSAGTPMATTAKRESVAINVPTVEPESSVQHILIKVRPEVDTPTGRLAYAALTPLARALTEQGVTTAQTLFRAASGMPSAIGLERIYRLELATNADVDKTVAALSANPAIEWAEPDYIAHAVAIPNDPLYGEQWGLAKIDAPVAWDIVTGTQTVVIAVVDSGIDLTHPDLQANLWINPGEIAGNGIDDDNNGYVDDVRGWNFVNGTNNVYDGNGHGTQVTGVAAAVTNNALGIAGVCWNCKIMPVRVMADSGISNYSDIALGVRYAADKGAKVINLSLGGYSYSNALRDAIDYAVNEKGAVVVGGAGNDNVSTPFYPAAYDNVLAVAGTTNMDTKAAFSDYGTWVDISAPAVEITTTYLGGDWGPANGTSLATPFVAGVAALIRSQRPDWSAALVRNQLLQTADNIDALNPAYAGGLGAGRVNAAQAMQDPYPIITLVDTTINGDPLSRPTPGEVVTLAVTLRNDWWDATGVTGTLSTTDPFVTVGQGAAGYGDLVSGASGVSSPAYIFTVAAGAGYNHPIPFTLSVDANDGAFTTVIPFTITTRSGDEHFCGTVAEDMVWTNDKTYILDCNVGIAPGYTLTIQAGTEVHFNGNYNLNVGGALIADGTASQPIRFMPHTGGSWGRIFFDDPSVDAQATSDGVYQSGNLLRHVRIEGAAQGIGCTNATPFLEYVTLSKGGMNCSLGKSHLWLSNSDLTGDVSIALGSTLLTGPMNDVIEISRGTDDIGAWQLASEMGGSLYRQNSIVNGNYIYAIGNYHSGTGYVDERAFIYPDGSLGSWQVINSSSASMGSGNVSVIAGNFIYTVGGSSVSRSEIYSDGFLGPWETMNSLQTYRANPALVTIVGYLYVIGGLSTNVEPLRSVERAQINPDGSLEDWEYTESMAIGRVRPGAVSTDEHIYVLGGHNSNSPLWGTSYESVERAKINADGSLSSWSLVRSMTRSRSCPAAGIVEGHIWAFGGDDNSVEKAPIYSDGSLGNWQITSSNIVSRWCPAVASTASHLYLLGGFSSADANSAEYYHSVEFAGISPLLHPLIHVISLRGDSLSLPKLSEVRSSEINGNISTGDESTVRDTSVSGNITVGDSALVSENQVTNGHILVGNSANVMTNTVYGGGINVGDNALVRDNSVENAPSWGIQASDNANVEYNRVVGCVHGVQAGSGSVQGNLIANAADVGLELGGTATVKYNTFIGIGGSAVKITSGTAMTLTGNNFEFNTGTYDVEDLVSETMLATVDARNNWWGTTSGTTVQQRIWDFSDDYIIGTVLYSPVLTQPSTVAPAYVRAITLTPESPVGIQTVTFDVLFSREMDTNSNPLLRFPSGYHGLPNTWQTFTTDNSGITSNYISAQGGINSDTAGNVWIGTWGGGVSVFAATGQWSEYNTSNSGLPHDRVNSVAFDTMGNRWFATDGGLSVWYANGVWETYNSSNSPLPNDYTVLLAIDKNDNKWIGVAYGGGVSVLNADGSWHNYNTANSGLVSNGIFCITIDEENNKWFGTDNGISVLDDDGTWHAYTTSNSELTGNQISAVMVDREQNAWIGGPSMGVNVLRPDGTWVFYNTTNSGLTNDYVRAIVEDRKGNVWLGTWGGGISILTTEGTWTSYNTTNSGLGQMYVGYIHIDNLESKWIALECSAGGGCGAGVSVLWEAEEYTIVDDPNWPALNLYRASYNFSTLIPRGIYALTVSGAQVPETSGDGTLILPIPGGGMEIAPNSAYTFTVDYAGYINDTTAPPVPSVTACAPATSDVLSATWSGYDPESTIDQYQYAIGVTSNGTEVINWIFTPLTETNRISLTLVAGQTYYISVKARNEGGIWSEASSVGVVAGSDTCVRTEPASPEVDFTGTPRSGDAPLDVHFTSVVTGEVTSYTWSFGDGGIATTANPTHTYTNAGSFSVSLVVTGPGGTTQAVKPAYIAVNPPPGAPTATFSANVVSGTVPFAVTFTAVTSGTVEGWHWTFGDSTVAFTGPVVQHTYQIPGVFDVSLTVSNTHGSYTVNKPGYITVSSSGGGHRVYLPLVLRH